MKKVNACKWLSSNYSGADMARRMLDIAFQQAFQLNTMGNTLVTLLGHSQGVLITIEGGPMLLPVVYTGSDQSGTLQAIPLQVVIEDEFRLMAQASNPKLFDEEHDETPLDRTVTIDLNGQVEIEVHEGVAADQLYISHLMYTASCHMSTSINQLLHFGQSLQEVIGERIGRDMVANAERMGIDPRDLGNTNEWIRWSPTNSTKPVEIRSLAVIAKEVQSLLKHDPQASMMIQEDGPEEFMRMIGLMIAIDDGDPVIFLPKVVYEFCDKSFVAQLFIPANETARIHNYGANICRFVALGSDFGLFQSVDINATTFSKLFEALQVDWAELKQSKASKLLPNVLYDRAAPTYETIFGVKMLDVSEM